MPRSKDLSCGPVAMDFRLLRTWHQSIARTRVSICARNGKKNVAIVTKANTKHTDGKFSKICHDIAKDCPEITVQDWYIDIMSANLINETIQSSFEVFILPNLYGDIITDEAAQLQGGVGTAGSANIGSRYAMFEAIHGSAPQMIQNGLGEYANPSSILRAAELLLRHIGRRQAADRLAFGLKLCSEEGKVVMTGNKEGATASAFIDYLIEKLGTEK